MVQFLAVCLALLQNMHKVLSKRCCLSWEVSLPSLSSLLVRGLVADLDLLFLLLWLLLEPEPLEVVEVVGVVRTIGLLIRVVARVGDGILVQT